jgi:hypothetical protein
MERLKVGSDGKGASAAQNGRAKISVRKRQRINVNAEDTMQKTSMQQPLRKSSKAAEAASGVQTRYAACCFVRL